MSCRRRSLPYPVLAGDPVAALHDPDGLVLTRRAARKYFGVDAPLWKTMLVAPGQELRLPPGEAPLFGSPHSMRVGAVLKDIPSETHLEQFQIFGSGRAAWSMLALADWHPSRFSLPALTYVRLRPGVSPDRMRARLRAFTARHWEDPGGLHLRPEPPKDLHFTRNARAVDAGIAAVGALIVLIAAINFVTLMTARSTRRAVEIGVRRVVGARRLDLMIQFLGEALAYVLIALVISVAIVELALPSVNAFLQRTTAFDYLGDPALAAAMMGAAVLTGLIAGLYPAVVLSGFRPASALKGVVAKRAALPARGTFSWSCSSRS